MSDWNQKVIAEFRDNNGKVGGHFKGWDLLLLHTTGSKSGKTHITPLVYMEDGDRLVIIASKGGSPSNPDWYYNLLENPEVHVEVGREYFQAFARVAAEPERSKLYNRMGDRYPFFIEYAQKAGRVIPVVLLDRNR